VTRCLIESLDDIDIRKGIRGWLKLLAKKQFSEAADYLTPLPESAYSGELIRDHIGQYSPEYREASALERERHIPEVTDPDLIDLEKERLDIYPVADGTYVAVEYDLPLDGVWSDLTAIFELYPVPGGWSLGLYDLHVM
jgi:hypothetical protein